MAAASRNLSLKSYLPFLLIVALADFMMAVDGTIVNVALPGLAKDLNTTFEMISWVPMAYLLVLTGFLVIFGKIGDRVGLKRVFILGFGVFTLGSLFCVISGDIMQLIGSRLVQGFGAAMMGSTGPAMIPRYLPPGIRGRSMGIVATMAAGGAALGPALGGFIVHHLTWHWLFLINIPVGIVAILLAYRKLPAGDRSAKGASFDWVGGLLLFSAMVSVILPVNMATRIGWTSLPVIGGLVLSAVLWVLFIVQEQRCHEPIIDLSFFDDPVFTRSIVSLLIIIVSMNGAFFLLPFYLQDVINLDAQTNGLLLVIPFVCMMVIGPYAGSLSDRVGSWILATPSAGLMCVVLFLFSTFNTATSILFICLPLVLLGISVGFFESPTMSNLLGRSPPGKEGVFSSMMMTVMEAAGVVGIALYQSVVTAFVPAGAVGHSVAVVSAFESTYLIGMFICIVAAVLMFFSREKARAG